MIFMSLDRPRRKRRLVHPSSYSIMRYVVLGGGVAGVACCEELCRVLAAARDPADSVVLVASAASVKRVTNRA